MKTVAQHLTEYHSHTQTLSSGGKLIKLYGRVYDYFHGKGWNVPTRFKIEEDGNFRHISGYELGSIMKVMIMREAKL